MSSDTPATDGAAREQEDRERADAVARAYLAETGLGARAVLEALEWLPGPSASLAVAVYSERTIAGDLDRFRVLRARLRAADHYHFAARAAAEGAPALTPEWRAAILAPLTADECAALDGALALPDGRPAGEQPADVFGGWAADGGLPTGRVAWLDAEREELHAITARAAAATEAQRGAVLAELLTGPAGTRQPDPVVWGTSRLVGVPSSFGIVGEGAARGEGGADWWYAGLVLRGAFERLALEEAEGERAALAAQLAEVDARAALQPRPDRTLMPRVIADQWRPRDSDRLAATLAQVRDGNVGADPEVRAALERAAATRAELRQVNAREFADLTVPQIRALVGVCALLTDAGETDDGGRFAPPPTFSARQLYAEAGVNHRQPKACRDLVGALAMHADRRLFFELTYSDEAGRPCVAFVERPMFDMVVHFAGDDGATFRQWARWREEVRAGGERHPHGEKGTRRPPPWSGPLPTHYTLTMPNLVRQTAGALVMSRDVLARLERGARAVRGGVGKLTSLDWALFMELFFTRQARQWDAVPVAGTAEPVQSFRCYIARRQFLVDYLGESRVRKNPGECGELYRQSARVLEAGGLVIAKEFARPVRRGDRDVFVPNPDVILGLSRRAERVAELRDAEAGERAATTRRIARKQAGRGTGKGRT